MQAIFYTFTKRINSTARPASGGTSYNIILKEDSGLLQPEIFLKWTGSGSPCAFNYVHIPDFGRYYWISNWTYSERQWGASLSVDVLASWKTQIGAAEKYVLRSAIEFDNTVIDRQYPVLGMSGGSNNEYNTHWESTTSGGAIVLSVMGASNSFITGGSGYVMVSPADFQTIIDSIFVDSEGLWQPNTITDIGPALAKFGENLLISISNPSQFLGAAKWVPFRPTAGGSGSLYLGLIDTHVTVYTPASPVYTFTDMIPYSSPDPGDSIMMWRYVYPFRRAYLTYPPFGTIELDTAVLAGCDNIYLECRVDIISGEGTLRVFGMIGSDPALSVKKLLASRSSLVCVPISIGGRSVDVKGMTAAAIGATIAAATGNVFSLAGAVGSAAEAMIPAASGDMGGGGGYAAFTEKIRLHIIDFNAPAEDRIEQGRPLCAVRRISALSGGYVLCRDGDIQAPCTDGELEQISQYLTGGFFYE